MLEKLGYVRTEGRHFSLTPHVLALGNAYLSSLNLTEVAQPFNPIPHDGPVGELLRAARLGHMRPAHVHFRVSAHGYRTLTTHIFAAGGPHLDDDAVFGVTR